MYHSSVTISNFIVGMERLSVAVGRGRLWRYQCAQVTTRQSLETRHRAIQQVIKD